MDASAIFSLIDAETAVILGGGLKSGIDLGLRPSLRGRTLLVAATLLSLVVGVCMVIVAERDPADAKSWVALLLNSALVWGIATGQTLADKVARFLRERRETERAFPPPPDAPARPSPGEERRMGLERLSALLNARAPGGAPPVAPAPPPLPHAPRDVGARPTLDEPVQPTRPRPPEALPAAVEPEPTSLRARWRAVRAAGEGAAE